MFGEQVSKLRIARQLVNQCQRDVDVAYEEWQRECEQMIARAERAKMDAKEIENSLRVMVVMSYKETGDKKPHPKLGVRVSEVPIYEEEKAIDFAFKSVPVLLKLDTRAFESYAKGVQGSAPLSFVEWEEKVTSTIAKDLEE